MKVSFICTILNEERAIGEFLDSLARQSREPDEIVVVDGGSVDGTVDRVEDRRRKTEDRRQKTENGGQKFIIIEKKGFNRSRGRNEAIKMATGDIIVASDAGCILDKKWLEEIVKPFEGDGAHLASAEASAKSRRGVKVVGGFYLPTGNSILQKILGQLTSVPLDKINPATYLPSSRSIAFKKDVWKKVGGYPEDLKYNEDIIFAQSLKKNGFKFAFASKAVVEWPQRKNISEAVKQFFFYAVGDGMAKERGPHYKKLLLKLLLLLFVCVTYIYICYIGKMNWGVIGWGGRLGRFGGLGRSGILGGLGGLGGLGLILVGIFGYKALKLALKLKNVSAFFYSLFILPVLSFAVLIGFGYGAVRGWLKEDKGE